MSDDPKQADATYLQKLRGSSPPPLSETARRVLNARYLQRDDQGKSLETVEGMFGRVAHHVSSCEPTEQREQWCDRFQEMMHQRHFLPNSPTLMNAGRPGAQLAACFVIPVDDSMDAIFEAVKEMALVQKTGGGTGFSFSRLRPSGDEVSSTKGISSGPLTFMEVFNTATDAIRQGGKRRGANMGVLEVSHPDILRFIAAKADPNRLGNFNLSVGLTEEFMDALAQGGPFTLRNPRGGEAVDTLQAPRLFELIARCAWLSGEPGVLFLDRINAANPTPWLGRIESTNPCAELPLLPYESCNLGSINLARFVDQDRILWPELKTAVRWAVRFLDNVIETTAFPLPPVADITRQTRKIGLGLMGFADLLIQLGQSYAEAEALQIARDLMTFVENHSRAASERLANERGPYPAFAAGLNAQQTGTPRRNATLNTIAPTGTLSILAGCSAGIEPLFAPVFKRRFLQQEEQHEIHPLFAEKLRERGLYSTDLLDRVAAAGHARVAGVPDDLARLFVTAHEVPPHQHVEMQAAFQAHVDNSVSKTVNLPPAATVDQVGEVIRLAYERGCKGITVYRDGSRAGQVLRSGRTPAFAEVSPASDDAPCPACGHDLEPAGPLQVCFRCGWSDRVPRDASLDSTQDLR